MFCCPQTACPQACNTAAPPLATPVTVSVSPAVAPQQATVEILDTLSVKAAEPPPAVVAAPEIIPAAAVRKAKAVATGHAPDYRWITGTLYYIHAEGGLWVLRYGSVDTQDRFGGSVVLAPTVTMKNFREGDVVTVFGELIGDGRASRSLGGPLYRPAAVEMVDRAD
jgi:hypothetical protein